MLPCHSCYIYGTWRSKEVGAKVFKVIVWRDKSPSQRGAAIFMGELTPYLFYQNYLPILASFGVKRVLW